eukprot:359620-Chlamydomonas_euryale.AAC.4
MTCSVPCSGDLFYRPLLCTARPPQKHWSKHDDPQVSASITVSLTHASTEPGVRPDKPDWGRVFSRAAPHSEPAWQPPSVHARTRRRERRLRTRHVPRSSRAAATAPCEPRAACSAVTSAVTSRPACRLALALSDEQGFGGPLAGPCFLAAWLPSPAPPSLSFSRPLPPSPETNLAARFIPTFGIPREHERVPACPTARQSDRAHAAKPRSPARLIGRGRSRQREGNGPLPGGAGCGGGVGLGLGRVALDGQPADGRAARRGARGRGRGRHADAEPAVTCSHASVRTGLLSSVDVYRKLTYALVRGNPKTRAHTFHPSLFNETTTPFPSAFLHWLVVKARAEADAHPQKQRAAHPPARRLSVPCSVAGQLVFAGRKYKGTPTPWQRSLAAAAAAPRACIGLLGDGGGRFVAAYAVVLVPAAFAAAVSCVSMLSRLPAARRVLVRTWAARWQLLAAALASVSVAAAAQGHCTCCWNARVSLLFAAVAGVGLAYTRLSVGLAHTRLSVGLARTRLRGPGTARACGDRAMPEPRPSCQPHSPWHSECLWR